ncbi:MAG: nucleotide exchange factor GrpE [Patescibacteria group bacterium]|nr:nucleotide exchange factor GrpE [Patescibacteria group bacterium]
MLNTQKGLKSFADKAVNAVKKSIGLSEIDFDHICIQAKSTEEYEQLLKNLDEDIIPLNELPHAGRRITVAKLLKPFEVQGVSIDKIEVSEPKPKRTVKVTGFDHIAFVVRVNFDSFIHKLKENNIKISEAKQIGQDRLIKFQEGKIEIEIRNNRIGVERDDDTLDERIAEEKPAGKRKLSETDELHSLLEQEKEKRLRALADYQNLQKRTENERGRFMGIANASILGEILDCIDDFDRALKNLKVDENEQVGLRMVREKLQKIIDGNGLEEIGCKLGSIFDPNACEAVGVVAVDNDEENNSVREVVQKGYRMKDNGQIVRPVRVIVSKKN